MKLLLTYLAKYKLLIVAAILLAIINQGFSLADPWIFGNLLNGYVNHPKTDGSANGVFRDLYTYLREASVLVLGLIGVAMVSRIAKAFQDYTMNVVIQKFSASLYTDGLKLSLIHI